MRNTFFMHTMTLQYTDDVVVMYTFHQKSLGLWGWVRVQTRAGVHISTNESEEFYMSLRDSIENALEQIFTDHEEERALAHDDAAVFRPVDHLFFVPEDEVDINELID